MKYCNKCDVIVENETVNCPLCHQKLIKKKGLGKEEKDFPIQNPIKEGVTKLIMRILIFLFFILIGINIVLNMVFSFTFIWAPYLIVLLFYAYLLIQTALKSYKNIGTIVLVNVFMLSILSIILDVFLGVSRWSINYFIPMVILAGIIALVIFVTIKPINFLEYFIYMLMIAVFGASLLIFMGVGLVTIKAPSIITAFISFMVIIGMFMFGDKSAKNEFTRRFHF